jgi:hypothetical protein
VTECKCWEGWNGEACELDDEKMEQRKNLRDNLANGLVQLARGQEARNERRSSARLDDNCTV